MPFSAQTHPLSNGFYLACSWLWCLGGFFPLLLLRDYGWPALVAFTVFNVGGAIAMGFYFKSDSQQKDFEQRHKPAISAFSYITIAYQIFFVAWLAIVINQPLLLPVILTIGLLVFLSHRFINAWAIAIYVVSIVMLIGFMSNDLPAVDLSAKTYWPHAVLPLAIGFIFSPYLDITFHRAYKNSHNPKLSFAVGFGLLFLSLLGFVFLYASSLSQVFFDQQISVSAIPASIIYPIVGFLALQTGFTVAAHCSELCQQNTVKRPILLSAIALFSLLCFAFLSVIENIRFDWLHFSLAETAYKGFLFFYSLVFPLYLLLGKSKAMFIGALAICTPAYALGFLIAGEYSYALSIGVALMFAVVLYQRAVVKNL